MCQVGVLVHEIGDERTLSNCRGIVQASGRTGQDKNLKVDELREWKWNELLWT